MEKVYEKCCGIDVHKKTITACLMNGDKQDVRDFGTTTRELLALADWLREAGCEMAAMESTASYWKPLYNILEANGLPAMVVNASHMKAVPGRKTDTRDAVWIADLLRHGLLRASYIPDKAQRELRELVSYRKSLVADKTRELNRLQKMLEGGNIKLSGTITRVDGKSGRALLEALLLGEKVDAEKLREMADKKLLKPGLKASEEELEAAMEGCLTPLQRRMIRELLLHVDELDQHIRNLEDEIDGNLDDEQKAAVEAIDEVPGIGKDSAGIIIAAIGTDMTRFPTAGHLASWAGLCPGNNESAGKRRSGKTSKGNKLLRTTLIVCAHSAVKRKDSYFHAQYQRVKAHRGSKRAYVAVAHSMLIAIYHILKEGVVYEDLGAGYYNQFNREKKINSYLRKLKELGWRAEIATA